MRYLFAKVGIDLAPDIDVKHTTPEDMARSPGLHAAFVLHSAGLRLRAHTTPPSGSDRG